MAKKKSTVNSAGNYTKPTMRKNLFNKIKAGTSGGNAGQWSARKAQMLAKQYKAKGGGKGPTAKQAARLKEEMSDEDMMYKYISKYVSDSDDIDTEMENYRTSGFQALSEPVKAGLRKDIDFMTYVQMQHDEYQFKKERGL